jgi:hypothetical protein
MFLSRSFSIFFFFFFIEGSFIIRGNIDNVLIVLGEIVTIENLEGDIVNLVVI